MEKVGEIVDEPNAVILKTEVPLDGRESSIRHKQCNLGELIVKSMYIAAGKVDAAFVNSGSVRIDDQIDGDVTSLDLFRALPYGGEIISVEMTGKLLKAVLDYGESAKGSGAYLQRYKLEKTGDDWMVDGSALEESKNYTLAMNDFLLAGYDIKWFTEKNPGIIKIKRPKKEDKSDLNRDLRLAMIEYLKGL